MRPIREMSMENLILARSRQSVNDSHINLVPGTDHCPNSSVLVLDCSGVEFALEGAPNCSIGSISRILGGHDGSTKHFFVISSMFDNVVYGKLHLWPAYIHAREIPSSFRRQNFASYLVRVRLD
jgi:hypothetical protein